MSDHDHEDTFRDVLMPEEHGHGASSPPSVRPPPPPISVKRRPVDTLAEMPAAAPWDHGWRPADSDFSPKATAWRAWHAMGRTEKHKGRLDGLDEALEKLGETLDKGVRFFNAALKFLRWGGAILGSAALLTGGGFLARWLLTLHH